MSLAAIHKTIAPTIITHCSIDGSLNDYEIVLFTAAVSLPQSWDLFAELHEPLFHSNIIGITEKAGVDDISNYYVELKKKRTTVALFFFQNVAIQKKHYPDFSSISLSSKALYNLVSCSTYNLLLNGHFFFNDLPSMVVRPDHRRNKEIPVLFEKALDKVYKMNRSNGAIIKDPIPQVKLYLEKKKRKYKLLPDDTVMNLSIDSNWKNIYDYIKALSKKYASRSKKLAESIKQFKLVELDEKALVKHTDTWLPLYMNVIGRSSFKAGILNASFFIELKKQLKHRFIFTAWLLEDKWCGFTTYILNDDSVELFYIGLDYKINRTHHLYNCFIQQGIETAIKLNAQNLKLGRTAYEAKAIAGAQPIESQNYLRTNNPLIKLAIDYASEMYRKESDTQWQKRNPFK